jgi:hypothetical protein
MRKPKHEPWTLRDTARFTPLKKEEKNDMAKHTVANPSHPIESIPAEQLDNLRKMPLAPGSRYVEPAPKTATGQSSVSVSNKPKDDGGIPASMPVPASSEYLPPPERVTSSNTNQEPSR